MAIRRKLVLQIGERGVEEREQPDAEEPPVETPPATVEAAPEERLMAMGRGAVRGHGRQGPRRGTAKA
jgi:hypothetical protein